MDKRLNCTNLELCSSFSLVFFIFFTFAPYPLLGVNILLQEEEKNLKIKFKMFVLELARSGTVKGFHFFAMYLRGKEELIVSVLNEPMVGNI